MRGWLSWAVVLAGVLALVGGSMVRVAEACTPGDIVPKPPPGECFEAFVFPESGVVPANLGAFHLRYHWEANYYADDMAFFLVRGEEVTELEGRYAHELRVHLNLLVTEVDVSGLLTEGPATLRVTMPCEPDPDRRERPSPSPTATYEFEFEVVEPLGIGEELVELTVVDEGKSREWLPSGASCSERQQARFASIAAVVPEKLEDWRDRLHWRTEVRLDDEEEFEQWYAPAWQPEDAARGLTLSGAGRDRLWSVCNNYVGHHWTRINDVRMVGTLPGTDVALRTETQQVNLECKDASGCAAAPAPARPTSAVVLLMLAGVVVWRRRLREPDGGDGESA